MMETRHSLESILGLYRAFFIEFLLHCDCSLAVILSGSSRVKSSVSEQQLVTPSPTEIVQFFEHGFC